MVGAGLGGPIGAGVGRAGGALIDPIRRNLIGRGISTAGISRVNQEFVGSVIQGAGVGTAEYVGGAVAPAPGSTDSCTCRP